MAIDTFIVEKKCFKKGKKAAKHESMDNREFPMTCLENVKPNLYKAAMKGDMKLLRSIVEVDCPPDLTLCLTPQKNTVLHIAVEFEQQEIVQRIIQLFPSLISQRNSKGDTPLHVAARAGHLGLTKLLTPTSNLAEGNPTLEEGNPMWQTGGEALRMRNLEGSNAIHEALEKSHGEVALHLLAFEEGHHKLARDVNMAGESLLYLAAEAGLDEVVHKIIDSGDYSITGPDEQNPLHIAVIKGQLGVVKILLDKESNFISQADRFGNTVLHYASAKSYSRVIEDKDDRPFSFSFFGKKDRPLAWSQVLGQIQILRVLLEANPSLAYVPNRNGDYPIFIAIKKDFDWAVDTILYHCPDSAELVNQKGQNALHLAVMEKNWYILYWLIDRLEFKKLINEPDNDGNTPLHLATRTNDEGNVTHLIRKRTIDLTMSNKEGLTAMDICGYTETKHTIRDTLRVAGAIPGRSLWQERFPISFNPPPPSTPKSYIRVKFSPSVKSTIETLPIVTTLVATVTFAAAFTMPRGYKNDSPHESLPAFMRNAALQAFVLSDILAFCSSMVATVLLVYVNALSEDAFLISYALNMCYWVSGVAIFATITALVTAVYVLTSKESLWLAVTALLLGFTVPLFLFYYKRRLDAQKRKNSHSGVMYSFIDDV